MKETQAINFLSKNRDLFYGSESVEPELVQGLLEYKDGILPLLQQIPYRKPGTAQLIAVFPGMLGFDRFYLGDILYGALKYVTLGGLGIWWIKDILSAKKRCRAYNCGLLKKALKDPNEAVKMIEKSARRKNLLNAGKKISVELVKGYKEIQDTNYIH